MSEFETIYIESFVSNPLGSKLTKIFKNIPEEKKFIETTSLSKDKFIWKIFKKITPLGIDNINKQASKYIDNLSNTDEHDLYSFIELLKYYYKVQENDIPTKLGDMYNDKREFYNYNYDKNENYIIYLDITQLLPYNNKNAYLFKVVDANADITSRNLSATLRIPKELVPKDSPESFVRKMVKITRDTFYPYCLSAKNITILGNSMYDKTILKWKMEHKEELQNHKQRTLPINIDKIGLIIPLPSQAEKDFRAIFDKFDIPQDIITIPNCLTGKGSINYESRVKQITTAIDELENCDVICLIRGGGDLEDFLYFSSPEVFCKLHDSDKYIVTGIGHADDQPLCQLVADYAATTPTDAAYYVANMIKPIFTDSLEQRIYKQK